MLYLYLVDFVMKLSYYSEVEQMITPELLARINELARKKRTVGLTEEELAEQKELYKIYLAAIRGQVTSLLDRIEFVDVEVKK